MVSGELFRDGYGRRYSEAILRGEGIVVGGLRELRGKSWGLLSESLRRSGGKALMLIHPNYDHKCDFGEYRRRVRAGRVNPAVKLDRYMGNVLDAWLKCNSRDIPVIVYQGVGWRGMWEETAVRAMLNDMYKNFVEGVDSGIAGAYVVPTVFGLPEPAIVPGMGRINGVEPFLLARELAGHGVLDVVVGGSFLWVDRLRFTTSDEDRAVVDYVRERMGRNYPLSGLVVRGCVGEHLSTLVQAGIDFRVGAGMTIDYMLDGNGDGRSDLF